MEDKIYYYYVHNYKYTKIYTPVPPITKAQKNENRNLYMSDYGVNTIVIEDGLQLTKLETQEVVGFYSKDGVIKLA